MVLLFDLTDLIDSIIMDLLHGLLVVSLQGFYLFLELLDLSLLGIDEVLVLSLKFIDLLCMGLKKTHLDSMELPLLLLVLVEQSLVSSSILKHPL